MACRRRWGSRWDVCLPSLVVREPTGTSEGLGGLRKGIGGRAQSLNNPYDLDRCQRAAPSIVKKS
jgi:hypothetical protein